MTMETTLRTESLAFGNVKTYLTALIFIAGNILLPQLCHLVPQGGMTWLPIYFFTLVGAWLYGWRVGVITASLSPLVNSFLFGMPTPAVLPAILMKSIILAIVAGYVAHKWKRISIVMMTMVVLFYQLTGTFGEWGFYGDLTLALQDFRIGIPGMMLQIFGGYYIIKLFNNKRI